MPQDAVFNSGDPCGYARYTPGTAVAAGQVVVLGGATGLTCGIAHLDIPAGQMGALALGGGKYTVTMTEAPVVGAKVYWNNTTKQVTTVAGTLFGFVVETDGAGAGGQIVALHHPYV